MNLPLKNTERFSNRVDNYVRFRPHYPGEILPFLTEHVGLNKHWKIADVGSGTGISSEIFLENGNTVYAIEPNQAMREAAEAKFKGNKKFISVNAVAEATTLLDNSVDFILSGQAFHWFDKEKSKKEFCRIAKSGAYLLMMWNDRKLDSGFLQAYEQMLKEFALDYEQVSHRNVDNLDPEAIKALFSPNSYHLYSFQTSQYFDLEGLKGRLLSSSYAPLENHPNYQPMMQRLEHIFNEFNEDDKVEFKYSCNLYFGKLH